jgi:hypothetical protein
MVWVATKTCLPRFVVLANYSVRKTTTNNLSSRLCCNFQLFAKTTTTTKHVFQGRQSLIIKYNVQLVDRYREKYI